MIFFDFFVQFFFALVFFAGISGIGILILRSFEIKELNIFLEMALSFFASLCLFAALSVVLLFLVPYKLPVLAVFTVAYFLFSFWILVKRFLINRGGERILIWLEKYWSVLVALVLLSFSFFLAIYKTSLLDEWLHRPIVKFFLENGIFPLKNPYSPGQVFIYTYHYGTQVIGAALKMIFPVGVSEALDVMKIGFFAAAFFLFFGLIFEWSKNRWYALWGAIFAILCGGSFFLFDNFSTSHLAFWGQDLGRPFNYPLSYEMAGITWVNLALSVAFMVILQKFFLSEGKKSTPAFLFLAFLIVGFFLISELFGILMIGFIIFLIIQNLFRESSSKKNIVFALSFLLIFIVGVLFTGGVIGSLFKGSRHITGLAKLRDFSFWGYPDVNGIIFFLQSPVRYLKDFLLEIVVAIVIVFGLIKKKVSFSDQPLFFLAIPIAFVVPFVLSTSMGDLNLYKLTAFGILVLHLLFFHYFSLNKRNILFWTIIILFVFGSVPIILVDWQIQFGKSDLAGSIRCVESQLCYDPAEAKLLADFEKNHPGLKYFLVAKDDQQAVIDLMNSYAVRYSGSLNLKSLKERKIQYIFYTPNLKDQLSGNARKKLNKLETAAEGGNYRILRVY